MQFPIYHIPFAGDGMTIGFNAVVHVVLSHGIAIGALGMVVLSDWIDQAESGRTAEAWESYRKSLLKFCVLVVTTAGAITGVGIWFTTTTLAPRGIASMLRIFFWAWFVEWIVFVLELVGLLVLYFLWDRLAGDRRRYRRLLGLGYVLLSGFTAVIITGIIAFMLTSGSWPSERSFWSAFLNPSYLPHLFTRLGLAFVIGSMVATGFAVLARRDAIMQRDALRLFGIVLGLSFLVFCGSLLAYYRSVPLGFTDSVMFSVLTSHLSQLPLLLILANLAGAAVVIALAVAAYRGSIRWSRLLVVPALAVFIGFVVEFERIREFIRGPYLMPGYMWVNGVLVSETPALMQAGMLDNHPWYQRQPVQHDALTAGAFLFSQNCSACHTIGGLNDIRRQVRGRSENGIYAIINHTHEMAGFMPPFSGTEPERRAMARFLYLLEQGRVEMESYARHMPRVGRSGP